VIVYAKWWGWYGGFTWGPRFFLAAALPASLAIASHVTGRIDQTPAKISAVVGILALSSWVAIDGAVFDRGDLELCLQNDYAREFLCWYTPEYSALWRPFVAPPDVLPAASIAWIVYGAAAFAWLVFPVARDGEPST